MIKLKILVTYYSKTGNTERVAQSIMDGLKGENAEIKPIKDVDPSILKDYDLVCLGSGIYASRVDKSLSDLISSADELPKKFAFFCTHASLDMYQDGFKIIKRKIAKSNSVIVDIFDCMGDNIGVPESTRKAMLENLPPNKRKEAEEHQKRLKGHPSKEDFENAKEFALSLIKKL